MQETARSHCPYCGEPIELVIDCSVARQEYIEDCQVCCRPMQVTALVEGEQFIEVVLRSEDE